VSRFLINLQRAIAQTDKAFAPQNDYSTGWFDSKLDLEYSASLSEESTRQHLLHWLQQPDTVREADKGYYDRIVEINNLMEKM